ncbi:mercury transporter [Streptomyces sp. NPDC002784]
MRRTRERTGPGGIWAAVGAGLLMVACCAGPLLVAGGAISGLGGALCNPWLITVGAVVVLISVVHVLRCRVRRRHGAGPEDCCTTVPLSQRQGRAHQQPGRTRE